MIVLSSPKFAVLAAVCLLPLLALSSDRTPIETPLKYTVSTTDPRTANMCGPTHDEEIIYGLGSDGKKHYFAVGTDVRGPGITIWQSDNLTSWKDAGRVFSRETMPALINRGERGYSYEFKSVTIDKNGVYHFLDTAQPGNNRLGGGNPFWAPCIYYHEADQTYYLYYCCSAFGTRNSFIGCAKSKALDKGWTDCGQLIHTRIGDGKRFNAIDPVVFRAGDGKVWMIYGSFFGGIAIVQLNDKDPSKLLRPGTHGKTIASRNDSKVFDASVLPKTESTVVNHPGPGGGYGLEGASILYNPETKYYYLFVSYDNLQWSYHCRVGRAKSPEGPYLDYNGKPLIYNQREVGEKTVYGTKIIGPYRWTSINPGWVGVGQTTLFHTADGSVLFGSNSKWNGGTSFVGLRKVFWSNDGWPLLSPALYAGEGFAPETTKVSRASILSGGEAAQWEFIVFSQSHDPSNHRIDDSVSVILKKDGMAGEGGKWSLTADGSSMSVALPGGTSADGKCAFGWDQDRKQQTVVFSGLTEDGRAVWGQRASVVK